MRGDTLDLPALTRAIAGAEVAIHLAANADVRFGTEHPRRDVEQNAPATFHVLEAMRALFLVAAYESTRYDRMMA